MYIFPKLQVVSTPTDENLKRLISIIEDIPCQPYFLDHLAKSQVEQKEIVSSFQKYVYQELFLGFSGVSWFREMTPSNESLDTIDIYGESEKFVVVIELDKHRADQVC